jgi:hypothetical protein
VQAGRGRLEESRLGTEMAKIFFPIFLLLASFFGGAAAQVIGGGGFMGAMAATAWLALAGSLSGPAAVVNCLNQACFPINQISITGDTLVSSDGLPGTPIEALGVTHSFGGASARGGFTGIGVHVNHAAVTGNTNGQYVGNLSIVSTGVNESTASLYAGNDNIFANSMAVVNRLVGREIDVSLNSGSAANYLDGQSIIQTTTHRVAAINENIGQLEANQDTSAPGWDCGWCSGAYSGFWPFSTTSTMFGCWPHAIARNSSGSAVPNSSGCGTTLYGIDLSNVTFSAGGAPYLAPLITPLSSGAACRQGSIEWDASFIYICAATNTWKRATLATF